MRDCIDRRVTPPERVTSPTWGSPPPCKQALKGLKPIGPDGSLRSRRLPKRQSNNFTVECLAKGQLQRAIHMLNPYGSNLVFRLKGPMWSNYHLNHLSQRGRDFDTTIKFNASTGEEYCDDWIINCMWLQVALDAKLVCVCFAPFLSFLPRPASQGGQFAPNRRIFAWHITSTECTEKKLSP